VLAGSGLRAQLTNDQAADMLLNSARKAYNEKHYAFAAARFREFLAKFGGHPKANDARYGLALSLLAGPQKDYAAAAEQLQPLTGNAAFPQQAFALYYAGLAKRGQGIAELALAKPQDLAQRRATAGQRFDEAAKLFEAAVKALTARVKAPDPQAKTLPVDLEWAARARCDLAEMLLRLGKPADARTTAAPFLKDALLVKSRYRGLGLYYHGFAAFLVRDYPAAQEALDAIAPFAHPVYGSHARFLLGRTLQLRNEPDKAQAHYAAVLEEHGRCKQAAAATLADPQKVPSDPAEKAVLEALAKGPPPDYVPQADLFLAELLADKGRWADALARLAGFADRNAGSPWLADAQLRQGFCLVQLRRFEEALKALQPVADKEPRLADQALLWIGKAQAGAADPKNQQTYVQALTTAMNTLRQADQRVQQVVNTDPGARLRRAEILLALAETQQQAQQFREAAATYNTILNDKLDPAREEEVLQRQAAALHQAGDYAASDQACARFRQAYPKSRLLAAVVFRGAQNALAVVQAAEKNPNLPDRVNALARLTTDAVGRFQEVVDKFKESALVPHAHYAMGLLLHQRGDLKRAQEALEKVPPRLRKETLALTSYLLADCLLRQAASASSGQKAAGDVAKELRNAAELLEGFIAAQPNAVQAPDALLKLGLCHQKLSTLLSGRKDRKAALADARTVYDNLLLQFPKHAVQPQAVFERAQCLAEGGDTAGAVTELRRFTIDPLKPAPVAPLAVLRLAGLLRGQGQAQADEAARLVAECRQLHEPVLLRDPEHTGWAVRLQFAQALALRQAGKFAPARDVLDGLIRQFPNHPETARAILYRGVSGKDEALARIEPARKVLARADSKSQDQAAARQQYDEGMRLLAPAVQYLVEQANQLKQRQQAPEIRARLLYEAAWGYRELAEPEITAARLKIQQERVKKMQEELAKKNPQQPPGPPPSPPDVPLKDIPLQPSEDRARGQYKAIVEDPALAALPLAGEARLELAELHAGRQEFEPALKLLEEGLDKDWPAELTDRMRIRLGTVYAARKDLRAALAQLEAVARHPNRPGAGQAQYQAGECLMEAQDYARAAARFAAFRDEKPFRNLPGLTDRALVRLGHAHEHLNQWEQAQAAYEEVLTRFPKGSWAADARYGLGYALQMQKKYNQAVETYTRLAATSGTETAARAQFQIGLCRRQQKRYGDAAAAFLMVALTYDFPEWSAAALYEAARTLLMDRKTRQAVTLWRRVVNEHPQSKWAEAARRRLQELAEG
jgi:TolA-binding protein